MTTVLKCLIFLIMLVWSARVLAAMDASAGDPVDIVPYGKIRTWRGPWFDYPRDVRLQYSEPPEMVGADGNWVVRSSAGVEDCNIGVEWEERRQFDRLEISFRDEQSVPAPELQQMEFWINRRPIASPFMGRWQKLPAEVRCDGAKCTYRFQLPHPTFKIRVVFKDEREMSIRHLAAYGEARWRKISGTVQWGCDVDEETIWDGHVEAYNGELLDVKALADEGIEIGPDGSWKSTTRRGATEGILFSALVTDVPRDSTDRTIITFRSGEQSFSFLVHDLETDGTIYAKPFGVLVGYGDAPPDWEVFRARLSEAPGTIRERVESMREQTLEQAMRATPEKKRNKWLALSAPCNRNKFAVNPDGSFFARYDGKLVFAFCKAGDTSERIEPRQHVEENYLPVLYSEWETQGMALEATYLVCPLRGMECSEREMEDGSTALLARIRVKNPTGQPREVAIPIRVLRGDEPAAVQLADGFVTEADEVRAQVRSGKGSFGMESGASLTYHVALKQGESDDAYLFVPFLANDAERLEVRLLLSELSFDSVHREVVAFWRRYLAQGAEIEVPEARLNDVWRSLLIHMWAWGEHDPKSDRYRANVAAFRYGPVGNESSEMAKALDMYGHHREAEKYLEPLLTMQGSRDLNARITNGDGALYGFWSHYVFNTGFILWNGGIHYLFTRDSSWLTAMAPRIVKACDWLVEQRKTTMTRDQRGKRVLGYGFFPPCGLEDWPAWFYWTITNAYFYQGMRTAGQVLAEIGHPSAVRIAREAEAYRDDILRGIGEATVRCPVVKLQDGTYSPYIPQHLHLRRRQLPEGELGAIHLATCGVYPIHARQVDWILDFYEDLVFLEPVDDTILPFSSFVKDWFNAGGYGKIQPYLMNNVAVYLRRDKPKLVLRSFYNNYAAQSWHDINAFPEHIVWQGVADCKTYEESMWLQQFRSLLVLEEGNDLWLAKAASRGWFADGERIRVKDAPTYFGLLTYEIRSSADSGFIEASVMMPSSPSLKRVLLRLRHPQEKKMVSVTVNGKRWKEFDPSREIVALDSSLGVTARVVARYE